MTISVPFFSLAAVAAARASVVLRFLLSMERTLWISALGWVAMGLSLLLCLVYHEEGDAALRLSRDQSTLSRKESWLLSKKGYRAEKKTQRQKGQICS